MNFRGFQKEFINLFMWLRKNKFGKGYPTEHQGNLQRTTSQNFNYKLLFMKKIGILHGKERSFPEAFIARINSKNVRDVVAESVKIDKAMQGMPSGYSVIIDRISQDVPFYRTWLKNAAVTGTAVINNPFW